ncbi:TetR/AcrR family transcriptional regulator [Agromyces agglutinans]|uniref:TetR/AcrR family transcriptional regulator n=1 Tax=Agromyces agglutinans TaxID=2662258 RepID=UPI001561B066|nr:TetR family transcriptional regulator C-terminal domain-containing protein [Agromyces agglutinans]
MDRRGDIIRGVWRTILTRGIAGVSVRAVAEAAGVSVGLVQHYHRSKDALIRASAAAMIEGSAAAYRLAGFAPSEAVRHLVTHAIPTSPAARDGVVIWHAYLAASVADEELAALLRAAKSGQERELATHLAAVVPEDEVTHVARSLIALADGLAARVITGEISGADAVQTAEAATDAFAGIARGRSQAP